MSTQVSPICPPKWVWLLAGFAIGMFTSFLIFLKMAPLEVAQIQPSNENTAAKLVTAAPLFEDLLPASEKTPNKPTQYILQVGSFRDQQQADGLKTYLESLDISAKIEKIGIWYQVQVGPFTKMEQVNKTQDLLSENNIDVILQEQ
ncbi:MAG: SPOR domain-containing protein [Thiotrichaceae bacterium]|nr:SPOR domain-containing protein [Thiotrichaceae bacterium]